MENKLTEQTKQALINEYKLIQEKQSELSAKERMKVCDFYKYLLNKGVIDGNS